MPKIEEDGKSWLRRPKFYKGVVEPYKKKNPVRIYGRKINDDDDDEAMRVYVVRKWPLRGRSRFVCCNIT